ncbi:very short patch repair endonuclease [Rhizobium leguminosarum]|uniref:Very short patch repair endonuclease n=1 Tax=Rhizobium leguminosarum TaxID=384 RepID=A0A4Q1TLN4_RHILE|nr:very short patch repair endonuclease [Rhizobium leguminosarum]RXT18748.1 very short patch repair endonuclease [Rhizobium leguminosarum]
MVDTISTDRRSWNMSRIGSRNTKPELLLRSLLHRAGFRFRLHSKDLPGRPDIVLPKYRVAIFVHGCFWHRHSACKNATMPSTRTEFWTKKFEDNVERDIRNREALEEAGWTVLTAWECELKENRDDVVLRISETIRGG